MRGKRSFIYGSSHLVEQRRHGMRRRCSGLVAVTAGVDILAEDA